ncbi:hypothetical protein BRADI_4g33063v3 [Brachypodium distachyon]|uniref:Uncharacterized protein n=1 Tax=Brachypodium distachyon TaxID=15368 RepID=A0A2K2CRX6_BRADI|nr:hypothetical protein BRADI_4g33063v3 [Brachypodium distachyon]
MHGRFGQTASRVFRLPTAQGQADGYSKINGFVVVGLLGDGKWPLRRQCSIVHGRRTRHGPSTPRAASPGADTDR